MNKFRRTLGASTLIHDKVVNLAGQDIGQIEELMIDVTTGRVAYAVMSFGGFMGIGEERYALPWAWVRPQQGQEGWHWHCAAAALPAQYRREKNQGHGDTRDDREQEITQVQRRGGGVGIGESLGFVERNEEPQERGHAQGAHHIGHQNRRRIQRPSCLAGPGNIAKELCHEEQPN